MKVLTGVNTSRARLTNRSLYAARASKVQATALINSIRFPFDGMRACAEPAPGCPPVRPPAPAAAYVYGPKLPWENPRRVWPQKVRTRTSTPFPCRSLPTPNHRYLYVLQGLVRTVKGSRRGRFRRCRVTE